MKHPSPLMFLRIAQGDAYALAYEYVKNAELKAQMLKFERYHQHPTYHKMPPGIYSDDTQMSLAVAETLLNHGVSATKRDFAIAFFNSFKRDERDGYSRAFQAILEKANTPDEMETMLVPDSDKNGAAMRAVPLGVMSDPKKIVEVAALQAQVTHATWGGMNSAAAVGLMSHFALYDRREFSSMYDWCCNWLPAFEFFRKPWDDKPVKAASDAQNIGVGMITAHAVCTLLQEETSLLGIMRRTLMWGGDTDSVAAIAWGVAAARYPNEALPEFLESDLEVGRPYGVSYLKTLGTQLMSANL